MPIYVFPFCLWLRQVSGVKYLRMEKTAWFDANNTMFFSDGGVLCRFKVCSALNVRSKFKDAETHAKSLFDR